LPHPANPVIMGSGPLGDFWDYFENETGWKPVDNKLKQYMNRLRGSASQLLSDKRTDEALVIEIELTSFEYEQLQEKADERGIAVNRLAYEAVLDYLEGSPPAPGATASAPAEAIPEERKRSNPLLALDGIARR
jgi:hypothetical protein